jgi:hypothetical protein
MTSWPTVLVLLVETVLLVYLCFRLGSLPKLPSYGDWSKTGRWTGFLNLLAVGIAGAGLFALAFSLPIRRGEAMLPVVVQPYALAALNVGLLTLLLVRRRYDAKKDLLQH